MAADKAEAPQNATAPGAATSDCVVAPQKSARPGDDDVLASQWHDLMGRYHRITCALDRQLTALHGLTVSDFEVLQQLYAPGPDYPRLRMHELCERVHLSQSAFSRLIARLEQAGLVERAACTEDRRSAFTRITEAGAKRYLEARPTQRAILREHGMSSV